MSTRHVDLGGGRQRRTLGLLRAEARLGRFSVAPAMSLAAPATLPGISDQSDAPIDSWADVLVALGIAAAFLFLCLLIAGLAKGAGKDRPRPVAIDPQQAQANARAVMAPRHYEPALRVHLCVGCGIAPVDRPGGRCYPYCEHPVHHAQRIVDEASRRDQGGA